MSAKIKRKILLRCNLHNSHSVLSRFLTDNKCADGDFKKRDKSHKRLRLLAGIGLIVPVVARGLSVISTVRFNVAVRSPEFSFAHHRLRVR